MRVGELIGGPVYSCHEDTPVIDAARAMLDDEVGSLAVVRDGALVGIITERDIVRVFAESLDEEHPVRDVMTPNPDSLEPDIEIGDAANWMMGAGYRHLPVVDGPALVGMVSIKDLLWALTDRG